MTEQGKRILNNTDIILFDLDGVITSEENYWSCAAATVVHFLGYSVDKLTVDEIDQLTNLVFVGNDTIQYLKNKGINTNWDLGFVVFLVAKILGLSDLSEETFLRVNRELKDLNLDGIFDYYQYLEDKTGNGRDGVLWRQMQELHNRFYQEKMIHRQKAVLPIDVIQKTLERLSRTKILGVGTGRQQYDMEIALKSFGVMQYFDPDRMVTYDDITDAEARLGISGLTKPNPYVFLRGALGKKADDSAIAKGIYGKFMNRVLVVGDAGSDILAAKNCGAMSCAVLTGIAGKAGRDYFQKIETDWIIDDISCLIMEY